MEEKWSEYSRHNVSPEVSLYVELDKPDGIYGPGDVVTATVRLVVLSRLEIAVLDASLTIEDAVEWYDSESPTIRHVHKLLHETVRLDATKTYEPGAYVFHAKWVLPEQLPTVFVYYRTACNAALDSFVECSLWVPPKKKGGKLQCKVFHGRQVKLPPRQYSSAEIIVGKPCSLSHECAVKLLGVKVGLCRITLSFDSHVWDVRRKKMPLKLTIETPGSRTLIKNARIALVEDAFFHTVSVFKTRTKKLFEQTVCSSFDESSMQPSARAPDDSRHSRSFEAEVKLTKPDDAYVYADIQSHVVTVTHRLRVKIEFYSFTTTTVFFPVEMVM